MNRQWRRTRPSLACSMRRRGRLSRSGAPSLLQTCVPPRKCGGRQNATRLWQERGKHKLTSQARGRQGPLVRGGQPRRRRQPRPRWGGRRTSTSIPTRGTSHPSGRWPGGSPTGRWLSDTSIGEWLEAFLEKQTPDRAPGPPTEVTAEGPTPPDLQGVGRPFTRAELEVALWRIKDKAPGMDNVTGQCCATFQTKARTSCWPSTTGCGRRVGSRRHGSTRCPCSSAASPAAWRVRTA